MLQLLNENPYNIARNLLYWGRWNTEEHPKLNIKILLEYVSKLEDGALENGLRRFAAVQTRNTTGGMKGRLSVRDSLKWLGVY